MVICMGGGRVPPSHTTLVVSLLDWGSAWKAQSVAGGISSWVSIPHCAPVSIDILDLAP